MDEITIKKKGRREQAWVIRFIACYLIMVGSLFTIYVIASIMGNLFTFKHFLIFSLCCIPLSALYIYFVEILGRGFGRLLSGWTSREVSLHETFSADLEKARYSKVQDRFDEALNIINSVLEQEPEFPEALYLKGEIMWEGFEKRREAMACFKKVMGLVQNSEPLYRWALNYYRKIRDDQEVKEMEDGYHAAPHKQS